MRRGPWVHVVLEEKFRNSRDLDSPKCRSRVKSLIQECFLSPSMPVVPVLAMLALYKIHGERLQCLLRALHPPGMAVREGMPDSRKKVSPVMPLLILSFCLQCCGRICCGFKGLRGFCLKTAERYLRAQAR